MSNCNWSLISTDDEGKTNLQHNRAKVEQQLNHKKCLNEKKRREQESIYMEELAEYITGSDIGSFALIKQDKCAILQETITQVRSISDQDVAVVSSSNSSVDILTNDVVGTLLLEAVDGFLFITGSESNVLFVSENVQSYLKFTQAELVGTSLYSLVHEDDHIQLSDYLQGALSATTTNRKKICSLCCRMIVNSSVGTDKQFVKHYVDMQIIGLCRSLTSCLPEYTQLEARRCTRQIVCIAKRIENTEKLHQLTALSSMQQFTTKEDLSGKILACETSGHIKMDLDLIGKDFIEYCHANDRQCLNRHYEQVLKNGSNTSSVYRFCLLKEQHYLFVQTNSKLFKHPVSNCPEFIMSTHSIVRECDSTSGMDDTASDSFIQAILGSFRDRDFNDASLFVSVGQLLTSDRNIKECVEFTPTGDVTDTLHNSLTASQSTVAASCPSTPCSHIATPSQLCNSSKAADNATAISNKERALENEMTCKVVSSATKRCSTEHLAFNHKHRRVSLVQGGSQLRDLLSNMDYNDVDVADDVDKHSSVECAQNTSVHIPQQQQPGSCSTLVNHHQRVSILKQLLCETNQLTGNTDSQAQSIKTQSLLKQLLDAVKTRAVSDDSSIQLQQPSMPGHTSLNLFLSESDCQVANADSNARSGPSFKLPATDTNLVDEDTMLLAQLEQAVMNIDCTVEEWDSLFSHTDLLSAPTAATND